ncbi:hypothetical protein AOLI_G00054190 [Acnodon oligacanthus]
MNSLVVATRPALFTCQPISQLSITHSLVFEMFLAQRCRAEARAPSPSSFSSLSHGESPTPEGRRRKTEVVNFHQALLDAARAVEERKKHEPNCRSHKHLQEVLERRESKWREVMQALGLRC